MAEPHAFLSYTRKDDRFHGGAITALREQLELGVQVVTGGNFTIFQDIDGIAFGEHWPTRLEEALRQARFMIPIITPTFFTSEPCRAELTKFLEYEAAAARQDLILPIQFVSIRDLERRKAADPLVRAICERQWQPWLDYADLPLSDARLRPAIRQLAERIAERIDATVTAFAEARTGIRSIRDIDVPWCPEMVEIPAGRFLMGSAPGEANSYEDEPPQHEVRIARPFALGRCPVTFEQYDHFCRETGHRQPSDRGWGRGRRPAIDVSWHDAAAYCAWLSERTGVGYRLPSEAEWEYACRAGSTTAYSWGDAFDASRANGGGGLGRTTEVDAYRPNDWGLHDMHGNVWEWCEDVWHPDYAGAPEDGSAGLGGGRSDGRVLRGGSWNTVPGNLRSAHRFRLAPQVRFSGTGFRVARMLTS